MDVGEISVCKTELIESKCLGIVVDELECPVSLTEVNVEVTTVVEELIVVLRSFTTAAVKALEINAFYFAVNELISDTFEINALPLSKKVRNVVCVPSSNCECVAALAY